MPKKAKASNKSKDTHSYKGWLNSDSFAKRAVAIMGYAIVGYIILKLILTLIQLIFLGVASAAG